MAKNLVIVESPAKAKTIEKFLGKDFKVASSFGHIADLPSNELGVAVESDFSPKYIVTDDKKKVVNELKKFIRENNQVVTSFIGLPAGTKRGVVDNSYDVSLIVTFNSKEEQEVYQNDPTHISFIDKASNLWKKVQVFDSIKT